MHGGSDEEDDVYEDDEERQLGSPELDELVVEDTP